MSSATLPPLPREPLAAPLRVVVLTCSDIGVRCATALAEVPGVELAGLVWSESPRPKTFAKRLKLLYDRQGVRGLLALPVRKTRSLGARLLGRRATADALPFPVTRVERFERGDGLAALRYLAPDLAVVFGTYVLKPEVFALPRFGSINLHCGRLPDYKGAPPAFWELLNGEREVGVTVHRVTAKLDAGPILAARTFPLDPAPSGDPVRYADGVWRDTLLPEGIRMVCDTVAAIARGAAEERAQGATTHPLYRFPDRHTVAELRRAVRGRRTAR